MGDLLLALLLVCLVLVGAAVAILAAVLHALTIRNRVVPDRRTTAPLHWLFAPELAARLHRRLQAALAMAATAVHAGADGLGLDDVVDSLRARAVELDEQLVLASRAPKRSRRRMLRELQSEVTEVERLAERTVRMSRAWRGEVASDRSLGAVRERLELLESALRELDGVDVRSTPTRWSEARR